ncbi:MAG: hypothetical protein CML08_04225 [Puniceicoccaceae bacterium]|nr:hypothetical protein [Puniceicoccaceae bacterium]
MQLSWQWIIFKIKSYWRLFYKRSPALRNATVLVLFFALGFYSLRFDQPLDFDFYQPTSKIEFIQADQLEHLGLVSASLELFDTAPLYIPTKWNYSNSVRPMQSGLNQSDFIAFEPNIELKSALQMTAGFLDQGNSNFGTIVPDAEFDPRLLTLFVSSGSEAVQSGKSEPVQSPPLIQANLQVELLRAASAQTVRSYKRMLLTYSLENQVSLLNLNPVILLFSNDHSFASEPRIYQSSSSEIFDRAILDWLNDPSNSQSLPNGYLKLTFYPY